MNASIVLAAFRHGAFSNSFNDFGDKLIGVKATLVNDCAPFLRVFRSLERERPVAPHKGFLAGGPGRRVLRGVVGWVCGRGGSGVGGRVEGGNGCWLARGVVRGVGRRSNRW